MSTRVAVALASLCVSAALAQSTAFTYQGVLSEASGPANGLFDLRFRLYDVASGGTAVGSLVCTENIGVSEGRFTTVLDFGQQFATPTPRHLEIQVRRDTGLTCANAGGFVVLGPRQLLTAAPLANHARSAFALDAADGSPASAVFVDALGNVGIGTASPLSLLTVDGNAGNGVLALDSGTTVPLYSAIDFFDRGAARWGVGKDIANDFYINGVNIGRRLTINGATGSVAIGGLATTGHALQVHGSIVMSTTTRLKSIHGTAFMPDIISRDTGSFTRVRLDGAQGYGVGGGPFIAPLELPDGAIVTGVCIDAVDEVSSSDVIVRLGRTSCETAGTAVMAAVSTSGALNDVVQHPCTSVIDFALIDNASHAYWLSAEMYSFGATEHRIVSARVTYTINQPLP